jgi:hypothetical protein
MLVKCICTNCAGHLAFEEGNAGTKIDCPHCGFETTLYLPGTEKPDPVLVNLAKRLVFRRWLIWLGAGLLVLVAFGFALLHWGLPLAEGLLPENTSKAWAVALLLVMCLATPVVLVLLLFWLAMPVLMFFQLRQLTRALERIEADSRAEEEEEEETPLASESDKAEPKRF